MKRIMLLAILVTGLLFVSAIPAMAGDALYLFIMNGDKTRPVKVSFAAGSCYQGGTASGQDFKLAPGKSDRVHVQRDQDSSCTSHMGYFTLTFTPTAGGGNSTQNFAFTNDGQLGLSSTANAYPGKFGKVDSKFCVGKDDCNTARDYLYTTSNAPDQITAGVSVGEWEFICSRECAAVKVTTSISESQGKENKVEDSTRQALKVSLEAGIKVEGPFGFNSKVKAEGEYETTHSKSMSSSIMTMKSVVTEIDTKIYDMEWMEKNGVKAIWQWKITTPITKMDGEKSEIEIKTRFLTCTRDSIAPTYYPGSPGNTNACKATSSN